MGGLDLPGILDGEIPIQQPGGVGEELILGLRRHHRWLIRGPWRILDEGERSVRFGLEQVDQCLRQDRVGHLSGALVGGQVVETVEDLVHERAAERGQTRALGQAVDRPEPVEQSAGQVVPGTARR